MDNIRPEDLLNYMIPLPKEKTMQVESMATATLAYMGDALFEMHVRDHLLHQAETNIHQLHNKTVSYVNASSQAWMVLKLAPHLSPTEAAVVKRGRNGKSGTVPRNADVQEYRHATGFEALLGWLYFSNNIPRLVKVMGMAVTLLELSRNEECSGHEAI